MRRRLSYSNVAATLALVFAMSGGAVAATHYAISSTKQISPKVLKSLKGKNGAKGAAGAAGAKGATGAAGPTGKEGKEGAQGIPGPFPTTLPHGVTITGNYALVGGASIGGTGNDWGASEISFPYPLASPPTAKVVLQGGPAQEGCSGTLENPTAASGTLCVYEGQHSGVTTGFPTVCGPVNCSSVSTTGGWVRAFAVANNTRWFDAGTWAVTG
jgi:hypothetical protein